MKILSWMQKAEDVKHGNKVNAHMDDPDRALAKSKKFTKKTK